MYVSNFFRDLYFMRHRPQSGRRDAIAERARENGVKSAEVAANVA